MAISSIANVQSGIQPPAHLVKRWSGTYGVMASSWGFSANSNYGPGAFSSALNGTNLGNLVVGQIPFTDPNSGNPYLAYWDVQAWWTAPRNGSMILMADRLWHNGGFTITSSSAQSITSPTWPARDEDGATSGKGVLIGLEVSATVGAATPTITVAYTNSAGTASRSGINVVATASAAATGTFYPIGLQAGDIGVRSVQSMTLSASWISGTVNLVAYRPVGLVHVNYGADRRKFDALNLGLPQMYAGSVPFLLSLQQQAAGNQTSDQFGSVSFAWG
jgi:hypothetical protein